MIVKAMLKGNFVLLNAQINLKKGLYHASAKYILLTLIYAFFCLIIRNDGKYDVKM